MGVFFWEAHTNPKYIHGTPTDLRACDMDTRLTELDPAPTPLVDHRALLDPLVERPDWDAFRPDTPRAPLDDVERLWARIRLASSDRAAPSRI